MVNNCKARINFQINLPGDGVEKSVHHLIALHKVFKKVVFTPSIKWGHAEMRIITGIINVCRSFFSYILYFKCISGVVGIESSQVRLQPILAFAHLQQYSDVELLWQSLSVSPEV